MLGLRISAAWAGDRFDREPYSFLMFTFTSLRVKSNSLRKSRLMNAPLEPARIPDDRISIEKRNDGTLLVRVRSESNNGHFLPDAVFSFRCGDPQYSYWITRLESQRIR